jgi:hypothetical protein
MYCDATGRIEMKIKRVRLISPEMSRLDSIVMSWASYDHGSTAGESVGIVLAVGRSISS